MESNSQLQKNPNPDNNLENKSNLLTLLNMFEKKFLSDCKIINNLTKTEYK